MIKKGAVVGCGFFADNHLNAWRELDGVEIVAICDLDRSRLEQVGDRFGIKNRYTDLKQMLVHENLDFVDIITTVASHREIVSACAAAVKTVICQKPIADSVMDATAMADVCEANDAEFIIHENFRWQKPFRVIKEIVDSGRIGTPYFARFSFRHGYDNYVNQPYLAEIERFAIMDVGLHLFDLARHFLGEVDCLSCNAQSLNPIVRGEDAFTVLLRHRSGATCVCECSYFSKYVPEPFPQTLALIEGDKGTIELTHDYKLSVHVDGEKQKSSVEPDVPRWGTKPWHAVQESVFAFQANAVEIMFGRRTNQQSGADNIQTLRLALAAYRSDAEGQMIDMNTWREQH